MAQILPMAWGGTGVQSQVKVIPKTQKMVLDASLLNSQHYKVQIKSKVEQFQGKGVAPLLYSLV